MTISNKIQILLDSDPIFRDAFWAPGARFYGSNKYGFYIFDSATDRRVRIGSKKEADQYAAEANRFRQQMLAQQDTSGPAYRAALQPFVELLGPFGSYVHLGDLSHQLKFPIEDSAEEAVAERRQWAQALTDFKASLEPVWDLLQKAKANATGYTEQFALSQHAVLLKLRFGEPEQTFPLTQEGMLRLVEVTAEWKECNNRSRDSYNKALGLFDFAKPAQSAPGRDFDHLPWKIFPWSRSVELSRWEETERKLRDFYAANIAPFLPTLTRLFTLAKEGEVRVHLQLWEDGVRIMHVLDTPGSREIKAYFKKKADIARSFPYTAQGIRELSEHVEALLEQIRQDVLAMTELQVNIKAMCSHPRDHVTFDAESGMYVEVRKFFGHNHIFRARVKLSLQNLKDTFQGMTQAKEADAIKALERCVLYKYNVQRARLGLPKALILETLQGPEVQTQLADFKALLTVAVVEKMMADLRMFRKNNPGLETRLLKEKAGLRAL